MKKYYGVLMCALIALAIVLGASVFGELAQRDQYRRELERLTELISPFAPPAQTQTPEPTVSATAPPTPVPTQPPTEKYAELLALNSDLAGWISIEGTIFDYPVMYKPDSKEYYLRRGFDKTYNYYGTPYIWEYCELNSDNLIIHGHNIRGDDMFGLLERYKEEDYYKEHPVIRFDTMEEYGVYDIVSVFVTTIAVGAADAYPYYQFIDARDQEEYDQFIADVKELSFYDTGVDAQYSDKLITLSTCDYTREEGRLVVVARKRAD